MPQHSTKQTKPARRPPHDDPPAKRTLHPHSTNVFEGEVGGAREAARHKSQLTHAASNKNGAFPLVYPRQRPVRTNRTHTHTTHTTHSQHVTHADRCTHNTKLTRMIMALPFCRTARLRSSLSPPARLLTVLDCVRATTSNRETSEVASLRRTPFRDESFRIHL